MERIILHPKAGQMGLVTKTKKLYLARPKSFEEWCEDHGWKSKKHDLDLVRDYLADVARDQGIMDTIFPTSA